MPLALATLAWACGLGVGAAGWLGGTAVAAGWLGGAAVAAGLGAAVGCAAGTAVAAAVGAAAAVDTAVAAGAGVAVGFGFCASSTFWMASSTLTPAGLPLLPTSVIVRAGWYVLLRSSSRGLLPSAGITRRITSASKPSRAVSTSTVRPQGRLGSSCARGRVSGGMRLVTIASSTWTFQAGFLPYSAK